MKLRFSLKALLLTTAVVAGVLAYHVYKTQRQVATIATITKLGGSFAYAHQLKSNGVASPNPSLPGPAWLRSLIGDKYFVRLAKIAFSRGTDDTVAALDDCDLSTVEHVLILSKEITDRGLENLTDRKLPRLRRLRLDETSISDNGLATLSKNLANLEELHLCGTTITDEGIQHLSNMKQLLVLSVVYTKVSSEGVRKLKAKMPLLMVVEK